jgi:hypothetical protein
MNDPVLTAFLERQYRDAMALAAASDLLRLVPLGGDPPRKYLADFRCKGLVKAPDGSIVEAERFVVGIWLPDDYLRTADPFTVLTWLEPRAIFHPNVSDVAPFLCVGHLAPATPLVDLLYRVFELVTFNRVTMVETNALNQEACAWSRRNLHRFPIDRRPLKRRAAATAPAADFTIEPIEVTP